MSEKEQESQVKIGQKLQAARQSKGYTLDDLQQLTKIQKRYLIAIEDEKFDELPGDFYVRAFVKQYADTVGLDGNDLLKEFDEQLPKTKTEEYSDHISQAVETRASHRKTVSGSVSKLRQHLPTIIIACVIVIVLAAIWVTAIVRGHQDSSTKIDNSSVSVSGESRKKASSHKRAASHKKAKSTTQSIKLTEASRNNASVIDNAGALKKDARLQITAKQRAWNSVTTDGTSAFSRTMDANSKANVTIRRNANTVVITVGNAAGTTLKLNGKTINFTDSGRYNNTRTITIHFGNNRSSSSSATSSTTTTRNNQTTSRNTTTTPSRTVTNQGNTNATNRTTTGTANTQTNTTNQQTTTTNNRQ